MNIRLTHLGIRTKQTIEEIQFSETATFLYGPIGKGKSTVARLVDYCFGGRLERTPAIQQEFVSVALGATLGDYECTFERGAEDTQLVRVTWTRGESEFGSVNAPLSAAEAPLLEAEVYNLSDLMFHLCGVDPIKVPKRSRDPDSPMIRLSFRDIWRYCYLDQTHLDSSFFRLEDPFRGRKSQDAMRFFTGLHSERLSQIQADLSRTIHDTYGEREAVAQIRRFMGRFGFSSENELIAQIQAGELALRAARERKRELERNRTASMHPTDNLRTRLREMGRIVSDIREAIGASRDTLAEQVALRAELITAKVKAGRVEQAGRILGGVDYVYCPQCGADVPGKSLILDQCHLCGSTPASLGARAGADTEAVRRELNERIDQIADSMSRTIQALKRSERELQIAEDTKSQLDRRLEDELSRYDSAFVETVRMVDREIATLEERLRSLDQLLEMPKAINELEERLGASRGRIDGLRTAIEDERRQLRFADANVHAIAERFKTMMLDVGFPGVSADDDLVLDPRNWKPIVRHSGQEWGFWDTGSGGKKTLFNVCYALAVHAVAQVTGMPVPNILIIDSPTKNISKDENPELVQSLYREIFRFAADMNGTGTQLLLIDSDLVEPDVELTGFIHRRMAGEPDAPSLISYYIGP